jgi:predicted metal-dependent enzyme (double-stranded beta helix superfamily)
MTASLDSPIRSFFERLEALLQREPDMAAIGATLEELARDTDYFEHHIARLPADRASLRPIHAPEEGPRLVLVHRPYDVMGPVHSHNVWIAIAPIAGCETHRRYDVVERKTRGHARLELAEERHVDAGPQGFVTLTPPNDIHAHGHTAGFGDPAYILVLAGDNQLRFAREEFDLTNETCRVLEPGDPGGF